MIESNTADSPFFKAAAQVARTVSGRLIVSRAGRTDPADPLRVQLRAAALDCLTELYAAGMPECDIADAVATVAELQDGCGRLAHQTYGSPAGVPPVHIGAALQHLALAMDTNSGTLQDDSARHAVSIRKRYGWAGLHAVAGLLCVDRAVERIEASDPYRAGALAAQAQDCAAMSRVLGTIDPDAQRTVMRRLSKSGTDAKHAGNRAARGDAIELYVSRKWASRRDAARQIAKQVHKEAPTVEKWLIAHDKSQPKNVT